MTTNILQLLHTTAAYQSAAAQLMVNETNFIAQQLDLKETVPPIAMTATNQCDVEPPTDGVGGSVLSENYSFYFHNGRFQSVRKQKWFEKVSPPAHDILDLADRRSLLDTNSAYDLAKQRLASISVDVPALEQRKACIPDFGARLRFSRGNDVVDVRLCYECDMLEITHDGKFQMPDFDPAHDAFVRALQKVFPEDRVVRGLKLKGQ